MQRSFTYRRRKQRARQNVRRSSITASLKDMVKMSDGMSDGTGCSFSLETFCHLPGAKIQKDMYFYSLLVYTEVRDAFLKIVCRQRSGCMAAHSAEQIARWFLAHNRIAESSAGAESISNLKLQKLLYYAQGCFLAMTGNSLFPDKIVALLKAFIANTRKMVQVGFPLTRILIFRIFPKKKTIF